MLEVLLKKDAIYNAIFIEYLGEMNSLDFDDGQYDAVVMSGAFDKGHLSVKAPREIARIIKRGGYLVNAITLEKFSEEYDKAVEEEMMAMVEEGIWALVERHEYDHRKDIGGICYTFQKNLKN